MTDSEKPPIRLERDGDVAVIVLDDPPLNLFTEETFKAIDKEIRRIVDESYERATTCLNENRAELETLAQALLEYETLTGEEIKTLMDGGTIDRGSVSGTPLPAAGSSVPKAGRKSRPLGGPAAAGA